MSTVVPNHRWMQPVQSTEQRLRDLLARHAREAAALRATEAEIAALSRTFADERGERLRPTLADLKRRLGAIRKA